jgi:hypothetical protein
MIHDPDIDDYRDQDDDARRDAIDERRVFLRATRCECIGEMPGTCPGPAFCPMVAPDDPPPDQGV